MTTRSVCALWSKPPQALEAAVERPLAGMPERRMAEIVRERQCLGEVLVEAERARQRTRNLGDFQGVGEARSKVVALVEDEHLRLVRQPAERRRMDDAVAIAAERRCASDLTGSGWSRPRLLPGSDA